MENKLALRYSCVKSWNIILVSYNIPTSQDRNMSNFRAKWNFARAAKLDIVYV